MTLEPVPELSVLDLPAGRSTEVLHEPGGRVEGTTCAVDPDPDGPVSASRRRAAEHGADKPLAFLGPDTGPPPLRCGTTCGSRPCERLVGIVGPAGRVCGEAAGDPLLAPDAATARDRVREMTPC